MTSSDRPLSPHLQIYKPQLTSVLSIAHRATGIALSVGTLLLVFWLISAAEGPQAFLRAQAFIGSWFGYLILFGWSVSLFYHLSNGIRHLVWDMGYGLELKSTYASGHAVLASTAILTVLAWIIGLTVLGSA